MNVNTGIQECNKYFIQHRYATRCKGYTRHEFLENPPMHIGYVKRLVDKLTVTRGYEEALHGCYNLYFGSTTNFRPSEAMRIYKKYSATAILDPCAGWGGRCFAAMECEIPYYGFDTNTDLVDAYNGLIQEFGKGSPVHIHYEDSAKADFSKLKYDLVLTSPPYWNREEYRNMPEYRNKRHWIATFLTPMLTNAYKYLEPGGAFCINLPTKMYSVLVNILGEPTTMEPYAKRLRNSTVYSEFIYVWIKPQTTSL